MEYRIGTARDSVALRDMWIECFNDSAKGFKTFWKNIQKIARFYVACDGLTPIAVVYHIPCTVDSQQCHYLYGASTMPDYRKKGIMKNLIDFSLEEAAKLGDKISFLYPSNERLFGYYAKCGYSDICKRKKAEVSRKELMTIAEYGGFCVSMSINGIHKVRETVLPNNCLKFPIEFTKYTVASTKLYGGYTVCGSDGYAIVSEDKYGECDVAEILATEKDLFPTLGELLSGTKAKTFYFNYPTSIKIFNNEKIVSDGMARCIADYKLNEAYIGLRNQ